MGTAATCWMETGSGRVEVVGEVCVDHSAVISRVVRAGMVPKEGKKTGGWVRGNYGLL